MRDSACGADEVGSVGAGSKVEERLSLSGEGDGVVGDEHEGTLHLIAAVLDGLLAALHAADGHSLDGVADGRQGSVANGQRIGLHSADDSAGSRQLLRVLAGILDVHDALEAIAGAGASLAAHQNDLAVVAADLGPVGDLAGEHLLELVNGQVLDLAVLVDDDGDAVQSYDGAGDAGLVSLQGAGRKADVQSLIGSAGDACAGTGGVIADGDIRLDLSESLGQGGDDVLHRGGTAGGDIAGQRSRRRSGSCGAGCGGRRGSSGRSCTAAGGQGSSSGSSAADGQERTTSDLFHNNISFNWAGPFVLAGLFSFSLLCLSWDAFIVAHRPSSCDHGGAKCR